MSMRENGSSLNFFQRSLDKIPCHEEDSCVQFPYKSRRESSFSGPFIRFSTGFLK